MFPPLILLTVGSFTLSAPIIVLLALINSTDLRHLESLISLGNKNKFTLYCAVYIYL